MTSGWVGAGQDETTRVPTRWHTVICRDGCLGDWSPAWHTKPMQPMILSKHITPAVDELRAAKSIWKQASVIYLEVLQDKKGVVSWKWHLVRSGGTRGEKGREQNLICFRGKDWEGDRHVFIFIQALKLTMAFIDTKLCICRGLHLWNFAFQMGIRRYHPNLLESTSQFLPIWSSASNWVPKKSVISSLLPFSSLPYYEILILRN